MMRDMQYHNLIIDGNNFLFRSFYAKTNRQPRDVDGLDTRPLYQAMVMLKSLADRFPSEQIYFTWDRRLNPDFVNFRREIVPEYKGNRIDTDDKKNVLSYMQLIVDFCDALGIRTIFPYDLEADDVIKYIADKSESSLIISSDRDLLQLVNKSTHQLLPTIQALVTLENFKQYGEVEPEAFLYYKAILGDKSDNILGLFRYGHVKAENLAMQLYKGEKISPELTDEQKAIITRNFKVMNLAESVNSRPDEYLHYDKQWEENLNKRYDAEKLMGLFTKYGFNNLAREIGSWKNIFDKNKEEFSWDDVLYSVSM